MPNIHVKYNNSVQTRGLRLLYIANQITVELESRDLHATYTSGSMFYKSCLDKEIRSMGQNQD